MRGAPTEQPGLVLPWELRARTAAALSAMYGKEVPAYDTLVEVTREVNADVAAELDPDGQRWGDLARVTAERHGAIRLGHPRELRDAAAVFAAMAMRPVGFYDLRDASSSAVPVVATAFRPTDADELARNPFRVSTSLLTTGDRRYFDADLERRLDAFLERRVIFDPALVALAERAEAQGGLAADDATRFVDMATGTFELSPEPVDGPWYLDLERVSAVAADIGGIASTHINHLTPRVLDIDELYRRMQARGIEMIDKIQGPPAWGGPEVLLRQTSFRALAEPRALRAADGSVFDADLRVRFGEVESRGIALTPSGRALADSLGDDVEQWRAHFAHDDRELVARDLAFFTFEPGDGPVDRSSPVSIVDLLESGAARATPIVYEDFLPRSAAGIFQSNLSESGSKDTAQQAEHLDVAWLERVMGREVADPMELYTRERQASLDDLSRRLAVRVLPAAAFLRVQSKDAARGPGGAWRGGSRDLP